MFAGQPQPSDQRGTMSTTSPYKGSPFGYPSSPTRNSPFRRPESPSSPSPLRFSTPTGSPTKPRPQSGGPGRFSQPGTPTSGQDSWTPRPQSSSQYRPSASMAAAPRTGVAQALGHGNALSQLQPAQVRTLRDSFQILDRDCDGVINREDVAEMLQQLGLPSGHSDVGRFFPPSKPQSIALSAFLNSLAEILAALSESSELLSAFSAFDDDDSGQIDWAELRDALVNTAPEPGVRPLTAADVDSAVSGFTGRRAFNRNMTAQLGAKRGDVFRYNDFVNSIAGASTSGEAAANNNAAA